MKNGLYFDVSLTTFVNALLKAFPVERLHTGWVLRDASGHLSFIAGSTLSDDERSQAKKHVKKAMSEYCRDNCILDVSQPGVGRLVESAHSFNETVYCSDGGKNFAVVARLIDRRIVGHDWLIQPASGWQPPEPARIVFASLKGGVGRSTALAVIATDLALQGRKVLAIDLDLEAPGIGTMLLGQSEQPRFGVLDWFVERGIHGANFDDNQFLLEMQASSPFALSKGLIHVVPAVGATSDKYPNNVLAKIARAYLELPQEDGHSLSFLVQTQDLIQRLSVLTRYDAILIDARAGLNESTAAALLGLGADVMLFGIDTPQTFASYRYLLAHLARFARNEDDDWLYRLRMVHAKASRDTDQQAAFRDRAYDIFKEFLYRDAPLRDENGNVITNESGEPSAKIEFGLTDPTAPHYAWTVLSDGNFAEFDPFTKDTQLKSEFYREAYTGIIEGIGELLENAEENT